MQDVVSSDTALPALKAKLAAAAAALAKEEKEAGPPSARAAVSPHQLLHKYPTITSKTPYNHPTITCSQGGEGGGPAVRARRGFSRSLTKTGLAIKHI